MYLKPTDEGAFLDFPKKKPYSCPVGLVECPVCQGHGGWNLQPNAYKLRKGVEDTPENRHRYSHFRAHCQQCHGRGWVGENSVNAKCIHEMIWSKRLGNCYNRYVCKHGCGRVDDIDSGD